MKTNRRKFIFTAIRPSEAKLRFNRQYSEEKA